MTKHQPFRAEDWHSRKHVLSRLRLRSHDYSAAATYLITICIEDRRCLFGSILDGVMEASIPALMAESWWHYLPRRFPGVDIHAFVVMPNHVHGIVVIGTEPGFETNLEPGPVVGWYKPITAHDYGIGVDQYRFPPCAGRLW